MAGNPATPPEPGDDAALLAWLRAEVARPFSGWDFAPLAGRMTEGTPPWDYRALVAGALRGRAALLDMGTGGGEFLASLAPFPPLTVATEGYPPNIPVARARLEPLGIVVRAIAEDERVPLPLADATFDLVINRHEYYDPAEVWRILRPGGVFLTQQVGGEDNRDLNRLLGAPHPDNGYAFWTLDHARDRLAAAGFAITMAEEAFPMLHFADVGALAYYLKAIQWQIPDFDVERYFPRLRAVHRQCQGAGGIASREHRFILAAGKPAARS